ncbi:MAG TPA: MBL fold hydrolase [Clostridiales bacterium UBA8960]|nr:MBL fold hydrolase [Clostridiales bacterium UBA8960]
MTIQFLGAAGQVTGSMTLVTVEDKKILVDCGQFQGTPKEEALNFSEFPMKLEDVDSIILTHAHIDHSGRIPLLVKRGFKGKIFCTPPTSHLAEILLKDSGKIHETEAEWENKKRKRAGLDLIQPLFTEEDAQLSFQYLYPIDYHKEHQISENIRFKFMRAGHLLGSSILVVTTRVDGTEKKLVFSGDLGNGTSLLEMPPEKVDWADALVVESTYGGRLHEDVEHRTDNLVNILIEATDQGGTVLIPSFAVGRTQEIIFELNHFMKTCQDERVAKLKNIPIYIDSPLALEATKIYENHIEYMSSTVKSHHPAPFKMDNLHLVTSIEGSVALNHNPNPKVIISASGMCEAGRITHHLKHNLWRANTHLIFIGYQAEGTLGRQLLDGVKAVKVLDSEILVRATIHDLHGFSGHADENHLTDWISPIKNVEQIFVNHGEAESREALSSKIKTAHTAEIHLPNIGEIFNL